MKAEFEEYGTWKEQHHSFLNFLSSVSWFKTETTRVCVRLQRCYPVISYLFGPTGKIHLIEHFLIFVGHRVPSAFCFQVSSSLQCGVEKVTL